MSHPPLPAIRLVSLSVPSLLGPGAGALVAGLVPVASSLRAAAEAVGAGLRHLNSFLSVHVSDVDGVPAPASSPPWSAHGCHRVGS